MIEPISPKDALAKTKAELDKAVEFRVNAINESLRGGNTTFGQLDLGASAPVREAVVALFTAKGWKVSLTDRVPNGQIRYSFSDAQAGQQLKHVGDKVESFIAEYGRLCANYGMLLAPETGDGDVNLYEALPYQVDEHVKKLRDSVTPR